MKCLVCGKKLKRVIIGPIRLCDECKDTARAREATRRTIMHEDLESKLPFDSMLTDCLKIKGKLEKATGSISDGECLDIILSQMLELSRLLSLVIIQQEETTRLEDTPS